MIRRALAYITALTALAALAAPSAAQEQRLTIERIYTTPDFSPQVADVRWTDDGRAFTVVQPGSPSTTDLYRVDLETGDAETLVSGDDLVPPDDGEPIRIQDYAFAPDGTKLLIFTDVQEIWRYSTKGTYYILELETGELTPLTSTEGDQSYAKFAPTGDRVAFVREHDLFVVDLASGEERALTTDGGEDIINGTTDWVYEEELRLYDAFRWSPDGSRILFWRFDQSPIRPFYLLDEMELYPELKPVRYPKAGTTNSEVQLGVIDVDSREVTWIDLELDDGYIARGDFAGSSDEVWIQTLNRHQNRMDLMLADVRTGDARTVMTDRDDAWLDIFEPIWIDGGERFVYLSERSGWAQLYLFRRDGRLERRITNGEWDVLDVFGVDGEARVVYFTGALDGPLVRPLYRVGLDGSDLVRLTEATGTHDIDFNPGFTHYFDVYSEIGVPPTQTLRTADGRPVQTLVENRRVQRNLEAAGVRPPDFDPSRQYPLLMYVYGGPGSQTVTDSWGGTRYLWHQILARKGYIVASVDNRGTGARGSAFEKITYLNLGKYESADQVAAARHFADLPYVDADRIGIWGWSYGGYMTALSVLKGGDVFRAGVSVAPVTDWRLYDTIYTERYMRTPQENPDGYEESSPQSYADRVSGRLLVVHGTGDDNVHPQNTLQLVQRLEAANKQFELRLYPNKAHGISGSTMRVNLYEYMTEWVEDNL